MKLLWLALLLALMQGCSKKQEDYRVEVTFPYYESCTKTVNNAKIFFDNTSKNKDYTLGLNVSYFDKKTISHNYVIGVVKIFSIGDWNTIDGGSAKDYLLFHADSILGECMPSSSLSIAIDKISELQSIIDSIKHKGEVHLNMSDGKLHIYYNDGSYSYMQKAN